MTEPLPATATGPTTRSIDWLLGLSLATLPLLQSRFAINLLDGFGVIAELFVTAALSCLWGAAAGLLAAGVQRVRGRRAQSA